MNTEDKATEVIKAYDKVTRLTPIVYKTPHKPREVLEKHEGPPFNHSERNMMDHQSITQSIIPSNANLYFM